MVFVDGEQGVDADVAKVVDGQDGARMQFTLDADVHLIRTRSLIVGRIQGGTGNVGTGRQSVGEKGAVGLRASGSGGGLERCLQRRDIGSYTADGLAADLGGDVFAIDGSERGAIGKSHTAGRAGTGGGVEKTGWQTAGTIKQDVIEDAVFIVNASACADHGLAAAGGIPGNADGAAEVVVGLVDFFAEAGANFVEQGNSGQVTIGTTGVAVVADAIGKGKVRLNLPAVTEVSLNAGIELTATVLTELFDLGEATFAVAESDAGDRIVQRIANATCEWSSGSGGF